MAQNEKDQAWTAMLRGDTVNIAGYIIHPLETNAWQEPACPDRGLQSTTTDYITVAWRFSGSWARRSGRSTSCRCYEAM